MHAQSEITMLEHQWGEPSLELEAAVLLHWANTINEDTPLLMNTFPVPLITSNWVNPDRGACTMISTRIAHCAM